MHADVSITGMHAMPMLHQSGASELGWRSLGMYELGLRSPDQTYNQISCNTFGVGSPTTYVDLGIEGGYRLDRLKLRAHKADAAKDLPIALHQAQQELDALEQWYRETPNPLLEIPRTNLRQLPGNT